MTKAIYAKFDSHPNQFFCAAICLHVIKHLKEKCTRLKQVSLPIEKVGTIKGVLTGGKLTCYAIVINTSQDSCTTLLLLIQLL